MATIFNVDTYRDDYIYTAYVRIEGRVYFKNTFTYDYKVGDSVAASEVLSDDSDWTLDD